MKRGRCYGWGDLDRTVVIVWGLPGLSNEEREVH